MHREEQYEVLLCRFHKEWTLESGRPLPSNVVPRYQNFQNFPFIMRLRASLIAQLVKNLPEMQETWFDSWVGKIP